MESKESSSVHESNIQNRQTESNGDIFEDGKKIKD
jgi:hypothetical protein